MHFNINVSLNKSRIFYLYLKEFIIRIEGDQLPKTGTDVKDSLLCTRVTPLIKKVVLQQASIEGLSSSEWLRNLIVKELRARNALPTVFKVPEVEEEKIKSQ